MFKLPARIAESQTKIDRNCLLVVCISVAESLCQDDRSCEGSSWRQLLFVLLSTLQLFRYNAQGGHQARRLVADRGQPPSHALSTPPIRTGRCVSSVSSGSITHLSRVVKRIGPLSHLARSFLNMQSFLPGSLRHYKGTRLARTLFPKKGDKDLVRGRWCSGKN